MSKEEEILNAIAKTMEELGLTAKYRQISFEAIQHLVDWWDGEDLEFDDWTRKIFYIGFIRGYFFGGDKSLHSDSEMQFK